MNESRVPLNELLLGDFDGDGTTDVLFPKENGFAGTGMYVSYSGSRDWKKINSFFYPISHLIIDDFDWDDKDDIFILQPSDKSTGWYMLSGGTKAIVKLDISASTKSQVQSGDIDGDGRADIIYPAPNGFAGSRIYTLYSGISNWTKTNDTHVASNRFLVGDLTNDGKADLFVPQNGAWYVSDATTHDLSALKHSETTVNDLFLGQFTGDNKADVFFPIIDGFDGLGWYISESGTSLSWVKISLDPLTIE